MISADGFGGLLVSLDSPSGRIILGPPHHTAFCLRRPQPPPPAWKPSSPASGRKKMDVESYCFSLNLRTHSLDKTGADYRGKDQREGLPTAAEGLMN